MANDKGYGYSKEYYFLPVGALTSKFYAFTSRSWELKFLDSFDPTNEFYIPLKLGIQDFKVKKVLPVNKFVSIHSYNWVSNRTRVFFDSLVTKPVILAPKFYGVDCSWFYAFSSVARTGFLFNRIRNRYLLDSANYDLFSISKISSFNAKFGSKPDFSFSKLAKVKDFSNIFFRLVELSNSQSLKFLQTLELNYNTALELEYSPASFSHVFIVGYNPYFFNPIFFSRLRKGVERGKFSLYTFLCSNFPLSFKFGNSFPNIKSLNSFFSGRHYTNKFLGSPSVLILDCNFILRFDSKLWVAFKTFLQCNPSISIYICGLEGLNISQFINFLDFRFASSFIGVPLNFWFKRINYFFGSSPVVVASNGSSTHASNPSTDSATNSFSFDSLTSSVFKDLNIFLLNSNDSGLSMRNELSHENIVLPLSRFLEFESYFRGNFFSRTIVNQKVFPYSVAGNRWLGSVFYGFESRLVDCSRYFFKFQAYYFWCFFLLFFIGFEFSLARSFSFRLPFGYFNGFSKFVEVYYRENSYALEFFEYGWLGLCDQKFIGNGFSKLSFFSPLYLASERAGFVSDSYSSRFMSVVESKYFYNFSNFKLGIFKF